MKRFLRLAALLIVAAPLVASCGGGDAPMGPDRTEAKLDDATLRSFTPFFPAAPAGYTRGEQPGVYSSDDGSTVSYSYENGAKMFTVSIGFSNKHTQELVDMMKDESQRTMFGFDLVTVAGRQAISAKQRAGGRSDFQVVVSNSRNVAIMPSGSDLPEKDVVQKVFESIDFAGIANK